MKFNKFLWDNYLLSSDAKDWTSFFLNLKSLYTTKDIRLKDFLKARTSTGFSIWSLENDIDEELESASDEYETLEMNIGAEPTDFPKTMSTEQERDSFIHSIYSEEFIYGDTVI